MRAALSTWGRCTIAAACACLWTGCASPPDESAIALERARADLAADDPQVRADAVDALVGSGAEGALAALEDVLANDPDGHVRERAVIGYGALGGRDAVAMLKQSILSDADERVVAAAYASLDRIGREHPQPPRGFVDLTFPEGIERGRAFDLHVRVGSREDVAKARVLLTVPDGTLVSDGPNPWMGSLRAGAPHELVFSLRAPSDGAFDPQLRVKLDYAPLDGELFETSTHARFDGPRAAIEVHPVSATRTP